MDGFSELDTDLGNLEVGHLMGLRWFQLTEETGPPDAVASAEAAAQAGPVRKQRLAVWEQCKELSDLAATEERAFTRAEQRQWDELNAAMDFYDTALKKILYPQANVLTMHGSRGPWQPGENEAACLAAWDHSQDAKIVPDRNCGCGFWVYWELGQKMVSAPAVAALVKGYGRTIEGTKGFRCSHASIEAIWMPTWDDAVALELEQRYQVPVYYKIGALLAMHKAPEGQRPLGDAWSGSSEGRCFFYGHTGLPPGGPASRSPVPGVTFDTDAAMDTYKALTGAPIDAALPCKMCGQRNCGPGQSMCIRCEIRHSSEWTAAPSAVTVTPTGFRCTFSPVTVSSSSSYLPPYTWTAAAVPAAGGGGHASVSGTLSAGGSFTVTATGALKAAIAQVAGQIAARYGPAKDSGEDAPAPADSDPPPAS